MTPARRKTTLILVVAAALTALPALVGCELWPPKAMPTPLPITALAPTSTPMPPTIDVAAVVTAAAGTAVAQFVAGMTATAAMLPIATPRLGQIPVEPPTATVTTTPAPPEAAPYALVVENPRYEPWGRPLMGCKQFDDKQPVQKFSIEVTLTNHSDAEVVEWYPAFTTADGRPLDACYYPYDKNAPYPTVPPGESRTVTLATFCETQESVASMILPVGAWQFDVCFNATGARVICP